ncbi:cytochrome bd-I ubiquinol oxidase subunit 1 apoprotein [Archaeoglobus sulfaticallidus PM70-1]|uniref:Cytochrome bd-I ubiquinol oxidase subunit 1 apoprotein n=1 Tax=Archaeoglobus sulfaticallidus PM70-1 TaxID=387631 RepID=N0BBA6_9EURY|nr:cytochrome ubiquinol oxidase subunit I [Archaeoglobus sulfaticallidus]AGK60293.1 cytochrome bd-I ubiquinol oxidase subunit 1 apoprotein [Archaeoglobus sulfaticallidus PM70-1]
MLDQWLSSYPAGYDRVLSMIGIEIHWIILQYILGLSLLAVVAEVIWLKTKKEEWAKISRTIAKGFIIVFAVGAAMGTASEFGLVLLWPNLIEAAGRYIYFPLYAEIFAFLMEVIFIYMFWYAWKKLPTKAHIVVGILAITGAWFSASMIMSVNSYMQAPPGIIPAYDNGWRFDEGYPKLTLFVPNEIVSALDVEVLQSLGTDVLGKTDNSVIVALPVSIVKQLISDAFSGKTVGESLLYVALTDAAKNSLKDVPALNVVDAIVANTVKEVGVYTVTFKSPTYFASLLHTLFAAITVSSFTVAGGYALSYSRKNVKHAKLGLKYGLYFAIASLAFQGIVTGHEMGVAVAEWNPEKFAAMEANTPAFLERIVAYLSYGNFNAEIPDYYQIPDDLRPPLLIHYLYYVKITVAAVLGIMALLAAYMLYRDREVSYGYLIILPIVAQVVSFLGWAVREIGRKPWTIYGVMDVGTAHTINPPTLGEAAIISLYFVGILAVLTYSTYKFLWRG